VPVQPPVQNTPRSFIVGLMSGTSADGIDAVMAEITGSGRRLRARVLAHVHRPFSPSMRQRILHLSLHGMVAEICELNFVLASNLPAPRWPSSARRNVSRGISSPSALTARRSIICRMRGRLRRCKSARRRSSRSGRGSPPSRTSAFVTWPPEARVRRWCRMRIGRCSPTRPGRASMQNIGGIGNLTFLPPQAELDEVIAFDTGPGNMVMDALVTALSRGRQTFDRDGRWAARGRVSEKLLAELIAHPFLRRRPPKTTGREEFGEVFVQGVLASARRLRLSAEDMVATATGAHGGNHRRCLPAIRNSRSSRRTSAARCKSSWAVAAPRIRRSAACCPRALACARCSRTRISALPTPAKEALAFAILAHETLLGEPGNVPNATGARRAAVLGKIGAVIIQKNPYFAR